MKFKLNANLVVNTIIIAVTFFIAINLLIRFTATKNHDAINTWQDNLPAIDPDIPDSLSHREYNRLKDSLNVMRDLKNGDALEGGGLQVLYLGITTGLHCDTCSLKWFKERDYKEDRYRQFYIKLDAWTINTSYGLNYVDAGKFFVKNGQGYMRKTIIDSSVKKDDGSISNKVHLADIPVKFRYSHNGKCILIPVSTKIAGWFSRMIFILGFLFISYITYLLLVFTRLIIALSKGISFTDKNVARLRILAISLCVYPVVILLPSFLVKLIFNDYFTPDIILNNTIMNRSWFVFAIGILFFLLYNAFRQGKKLKEEHDLTI